MMLVPKYRHARNRMAQSFGQHILALLLASLALATPLYATSARHYMKQGRLAEAKDDYIGAYEAYHHAYLLKPMDLRYKEASIRLSFPAAAEYVDRGRKLLKQGQYNDALTDFLRALEIDPSDEAANQEIRKTREILNGAPAPQDANQAAISSSQMQKELASVGSPVNLKPLSNEPITLHMVADTKVIYQTIGKIAGINVLFDPDYVSKRVPIDLNRVTLYDALRSVSFVSQTFWRPVTPDTIFVAQDTKQKRTQLEQQAIQTFYLTNITQANDLNEILNAIRNLMDTSVKLQAVPSQDAIVMRGTPDQLLLAQNIIDDLDKAKPEVVIDVAVMEVSRDLLRNIGIQLPGAFGVTLQPSTSVMNSTSTSTLASTTGTTTNSLTMNDLGNLNATNFAVSVGQATANLLLTDTATRILQNPEVRAVDGQKSSLKIGSRIPIATGSFGTGMMGGAVGGVGGVGGISPLMSTQFQYIDVGVNMEMQPTIHYDHDITLKLKIEISSETGQVNLGGINEPVIGQRTIEQTIRMKEGQPNLLGGILEHSETITIGGTPGLGEIPIIKYLFSSQQKEVVNDEIVFLLIPHLVRGANLSQQNLRTIDTGTSSNVQLRRIEVPQALAEIQAQSQAQKPLAPATPTGPPVSAAEAINQAAAQFQQNAQNIGTPKSAPVAPTMTQAALSGSPPLGAPLQLAVLPATSAQKTGSTFQMSVNVGSATDLFEVPMELHYDPHLLTLINVDTGDLLGKDGQTIALVHRDDGNGTVSITASRPPGVKGVDGSGAVCTLTFQAKAPGNATVSLVKAAARNSTQHILPVIGSEAVVHVN
ncbi:MAG: cohesin domain-containing protein [Acidobacteriaceae bacterium]